MTDKIGRKRRRRRVETAKELSGLLANKKEIVHLIAEQYGLDLLLAQQLADEALEEIRDYTGRTQFEHLCDAVQFYSMILQDKGGDYDLAMKMRARDKLDKILGLEAQAKSSGGGGNVSLTQVNVHGGAFAPAEGKIGQEIDKVIDGLIPEKKSDG